MSPVRRESNRLRVLVFSGAGASYAVNPERFPTTVQFFQKLPVGLAKEPLVTILRDRCERRFGKGPADVEKILWCLSELEQYFLAIDDAKSPMNWVAEGNVIQSAVGSPHHGISEFVHLARLARNKVIAIKDTIAAEVYNFYSYKPKSEELIDNWIQLLQSLHTHKAWIDLVTTNYDLVLETTVKLLKLEVGNGFSDEPVREMSLDYWRNSISTENVEPYADGLITKLHGSVHWEAEPDGVVLGGTRYKGAHERHALISPGFKGVPQKEPFVTLHDYFERALTRADVILFIGFAFRDDYINDLIRRSVGNKQIVCIDPSPLSWVPTYVRDKIFHIERGFDGDAIREFWKFVDRTQRAN